VQLATYVAWPRSSKPVYQIRNLAIGQKVGFEHGAWITNPVPSLLTESKFWSQQGIERTKPNKIKHPCVVTTSKLVELFYQSAFLLKEREISFGFNEHGA